MKSIQIFFIPAQLSLKLKYFFFWIWLIKCVRNKICICLVSKMRSMRKNVLSVLLFLSQAFKMLYIL